MILMSLVGILVSCVVAAIAWHVGAFLDCCLFGGFPPTFPCGFIACELGGFASLIAWIAYVL